MSTDFVEFKLPKGVVGVLYNTGFFPVEISYDGETVHRQLEPGKELSITAQKHHFHVRCSEPGESCPIYFRTEC